MTAVDFTRFLGKRVAYPCPFAPDISGLVIGVFLPLKGYEQMVGNEVLFLKDGETEPVFVSSDVVYFLD